MAPTSGADQCEDPLFRKLRKRPEGRALDRADADTSQSAALYGQGRRLAASAEEAVAMRISSVEDNTACLPPPRRSRFERWKAKAEAAGVSIDWRPHGDASTLYLPGNEHVFNEQKEWIGKAKAECAKIEEGADPSPVDERIWSASLLRREARVLGPWLTGGVHEANPIPVALAFKLAPRGSQLGGHSLNTEFFLEEAEFDEDPGIAQELVGGIELEATCEDSQFTFHHPSFWDTPGARKKSLDALREEATTGAFIQLGTVPMLPLRINPRFIVEQGLKADQITLKLRAIANMSWGELSVNDTISLEDLHDMKLTSGVRFGRDIGILARIAAKTIMIKRDMTNAFRQVPVCPADWWLQCTVSARGCEVDTRIVMGSRAAVHKFQRVHESIARAFQRPITKFDAAHPPADPLVAQIIASRKRKFGVEQGERVASTHIYVDDGVHGALNDDVELTFGVLQFGKGESAARGRVHEAIIDHTYKRSRFAMSEDKDETKEDQSMEVLGVMVDPPKQALRYPPRKIPTLKKEIKAALELPADATVPRKKIESLVGKEKWMAHVALELNHLLASGYAVAKCGAKHVGLGEQFRVDQRRILDALDDLPDVPLVPASLFPQVGAPGHCLVFQDASTSTGHGGWFIWKGTLYSVHGVWPEAVLNAFASKEWSISPAEAWAEVVLLELARVHAPDATTVTDFTDNESTRAAANKGRSSSAAMNPLARALAELSAQPGRVVRTLRVTTKENLLADELSRGLHDAAKKAARELGLAHRQLEVPQHLLELLPTN